MRLISKIFISLISFILIPGAAGVGALNLPAGIELPELPKLPQVSGLYRDPNARGVNVQVIVHHFEDRPAIAKKTVCTDDPESALPVAAGGWKLPANVTWKLNLSSAPSTIGQTNFLQIARNGFSDWAEAAGGKVTFKRGANVGLKKSVYDGKNIIAWGQQAIQNLGVTYIRYSSFTGTVVDVDTIMNNQHPWRWSNSSTCGDVNSYDAENIMTHEIGHWMGLDDEYGDDFENHTMYGYGSKGEVKKSTLTLGDKAATLAIYNP